MYTISLFIISHEASELTFVIGNKLLHISIINEKLFRNFFQGVIVIVIPQLGT